MSGVVSAMNAKNAAIADVAWIVNAIRVVAEVYRDVIVQVEAAVDAPRANRVHAQMIATASAPE